MSKGRFGAHGGQYIPETLMNAVLELEEAYNHISGVIFQISARQSSKS